MPVREAPQVLVVEDEKMVLRLYERALQQQGWSVWKVTSGEAAVELALRQPFDIAVIDLRLKGDLDGLTTYRVLKALQPKLKGIIVTGYGNRQSLLEALRMGVAAWLEKPVTVTDLVATVQRVLQAPSEFEPLSPSLSLGGGYRALPRLFLQMLVVSTLSDLAVLWVRSPDGSALLPQVSLGNLAMMPSPVPWETEEQGMEHLKAAMERAAGGPCLVAPIRWQGSVIGAVALGRRQFANIPYSQGDWMHLMRFAEWLAPILLVGIYPVEVLMNLVPFLEALTGLLHQQVEPMERQHPRRLRLIVTELGKALGFPPDRLLLLELAATLHDLGKVFLPREILTKPGTLTEQERHLVQQHPVYSEQFIRQTGLPEEVALWVRWHHERFDGSGYPDRRGRGDLPLEAQILALAEALDTLLSPRPYKPALSFEEALARLRQERGKQFAPHLLDALEQIAEELRQRLEADRLFSR
jgi:response regulator RpfG family c-di-GMP phosphodiesterase